MAVAESKLNALYERHDVQDEGERLFMRRAFEAGLLSVENCADLLGAHREGSQRTYDALVEADAGPSTLLRRTLVTRTNRASTSAGARAEALSRSLARLAANDIGVRMFRRSLLGSPVAVLQPTRAALLLQSPVLRFMTWRELRARYGQHADQWVVNDPVEPPAPTPAAVHVNAPIRLGQAKLTHAEPHSFLHILDAHAELLDSPLGCSRSDASWFLLTGELPPLEALTTGTKLYGGVGRVPIVAWITVKALPYVSAESVKAAFAKEQRLLTGKQKGREITPRNLALLDFIGDWIVKHRSRPDFPRLMKAWNKRVKPEWHYTYPSRMQRDYRVSAIRVFLLDIRPKHAPPPGGIDVLERHLTDRPEAPSFFLDDGPP